MHFGLLCIAVNKPPTSVRRQNLPPQKKGVETGVVPRASALTAGWRGGGYGCLSHLGIPLLEICRVPGLSFCKCQAWAPDERFVDMITRLGPGMDDTVEAGQRQQQ